MKKIKLDKRIYNYIEYELYNYEISKSILQDEEDDAIYGVNEFDANAGIKAKYKKTNRVENSALALISMKRMYKLTNTISAIDNALKKLEKIYKKFFEKYYQKKCGKLRICEELGLSERSFYNYRDRIVCTVAKEMGLIDYE